MHAERKEPRIVVSLTAEEVYALQDGKTAWSRPGITMPEAKIIVSPMAEIEEDCSGKDRYSPDRLEKAVNASLRAKLFPNGDLEIYVPAIKLSDVRVPGARLPREKVEAPLSDDPEELINRVLPPGGIELCFGGSLQIIDIPSEWMKMMDEDDDLSSDS